MTIESVIGKCKALKLKTFAENLEQTIAIGEQKNWTPLQTIEHLFDLELEQRRKNKIQRCFKQSKLYEKPTIDQFDFNFHSSRKNQKNRIVNLMDLEFIKQPKDIILIGNPGVGEKLSGKVHGICCNTGRHKNAFYHRYGHDQSSDRCRGRPFAAEKTPLLSNTGTPCRRRNRLSFPGFTGIKSVLPGYQCKA